MSIMSLIDNLKLKMTWIAQVSHLSQILLMKPQFCKFKLAISDTTYFKIINDHNDHIKLHKEHALL